MTPTILTLTGAAGVNISGLVNDASGKEAAVSRLKNGRRKEGNREVMEEVARFIVQNRSFADENRNW